MTRGELAGPVKPLTFMEKVRAGFKGFVKSAIDYIPKGILFSALLMGGGLALGAMTGVNPVGVTSWSQVPMRLGLSLLLGGVISGGFGAVQAVGEANRQRDDDLTTQAVMERRRERLPERAQERGYDSGYTPPDGLPPVQRSARGAPTFG